MLAVIGAGVWWLLSRTPHPDTYTYGVSFNADYATELGLDWHTAYAAVLDDLQVKHLRLTANWPTVEPKEGTWRFDDIDEQLRLAKAHGADVILAIGRRTPRWPECHVPEWAQSKSWDEQKQLIRAYLTAVVERYRNDPTIRYWQVENEPFLTVYAKEQCGDLDTAFLDEELALVRSLDPSRRVLVTDSGNLGTWFGAYQRGDVFGTSVYLYLWNPQTGPIRSLLPPEAYVAKQKVMQLLYGTKDTLLIELSVEPWLTGPLIETPLDTQLERMDLDKFNEIIQYAKDTRFATQYLWGAEWWYWLKGQGHPEMWSRAKRLYATGK